MNPWLVSLAIAFMSLSTNAAAHGLEHHLGHGEPAVLVVHDADQQAFADEAYRIYYETEQRPFQVGRSDAGGRIVFLPERAGHYRIETASEDAHGGVYEVRLDRAGDLVLETPPLLERGHILLGLAIVLGAFAAARLRSRSANRRPGAEAPADRAAFHVRNPA